MHGPRRSSAAALAALATVALAALVALAPRAHAQSRLPTGFADSLVVRQLDMPVAFDFVPGSTAPKWRVLLVEQKTARMRLVVSSGEWVSICIFLSGLEDDGVPAHAAEEAISTPPSSVNSRRISSPSPHRTGSSGC